MGGDGGVTFDWPGVRATFTVANASFVTVDVDDGTAGGTRLHVYVVSAGGGNRWPLQDRGNCGKGEGHDRSR
jgi:hypothetical protein